jgi:hypothetical protein
VAQRAEGYCIGRLIHAKRAAARRAFIAGKRAPADLNCLLA